MPECGLDRAAMDLPVIMHHRPGPSTRTGSASPHWSCASRDAPEPPLVSSGRRCRRARAALRLHIDLDVGSDAPGHQHTVAVEDGLERPIGRQHVRDERLLRRTHLGTVDGEVVDSSGRAGYRSCGAPTRSARTGWASRKLRAGVTGAGAGCRSPRRPQWRARAPAPRASRRGVAMAGPTPIGRRCQSATVTRQRS